ncbi:MAG: polymer-forming cytoskeletal protein [Candidatus Aminicenantaceae bacterium]
MKEKNGEIDIHKITGFFNKDTEFKGDLTFKGSFRIDGQFKGTINSDSILIVGEEGKVEADIKVGSLINNGEIKGNIHAKDKVEVNSKGRVLGSITSTKLVIEEGAYLEASCQTCEKINQLPSEKPKLGNKP